MACVVAEQRLKLLAFRSLSSRVMPRDEPSHCFSSGRAATKPSFCAPSSQSTSQAQRWCSRQPMHALGFSQGSLPAHPRTQTSKRAHACTHTHIHTLTRAHWHACPHARAHTQPRLRKHAHTPTRARTHAHARANTPATSTALPGGLGLQLAGLLHRFGQSRDVPNCRGQEQGPVA